MQITRGSKPVHVDGVRARTLAALQAAAPSTPWLVADLSLGGWRGRFAAAQLRAGLGLPEPGAVAITPPMAARGGMPAYAEIVGAAIDAEAAGDVTMLSALACAEEVASALADRPPHTVLVLAPRFGLSWEPEDALFVGLLARALAETPHRFVLVAGDPMEPPSGMAVDWAEAGGETADAGDPGLFALVPGVVDPDVMAALGDECAGLRLASGGWLIPPERRRDPKTCSRLDYDKLAHASRPFGWLRAYARCHGSNFHVDPPELYGEAWRRTSEGAVGIALRLLERAADCARTPAERALATAQAQGARIAAQRFAAAASAPDPPPSGAWRGFLLQAKGWGLVMQDEAARADACFTEARALAEREGPSREYDYLLNISALARFKLGDLDGALALERRIEAALAAQAEPDARLTFVNAINLARLHRRMGAWDGAHAYYDRAFATVGGVRSESDAVYANVCSASVETGARRPQGAFPFLLRACLHWVACAVPEALPRRAFLAIVGRPPAPGENRTDAVCAMLASRLAQAAEQALGEPSIVAADAPAPVFARYDVGTGPIEAVVAGTGFSLMVARSARPPAYDGPAHAHLRRMLFGLVSRLSASRLTGAEPLVIDDRCGREMALTLPAVVDAAVRVGAAEIRLPDGDLSLGPDRRDEIERASRVRLGPGVTRIADDAATFRRCRPPFALSPDRRRVVDALTDEPTLSALAHKLCVDYPIMRERVRSLERERVVVVESRSAPHGP